MQEKADAGRGMMSSPAVADSGQPIYYKHIDRLLARDDRSARFLKNITRNEWCLGFSEKDGYFYPPVLLLECLAQAAGELDMHMQQADPPRLPILLRIKEVRIGRLAKPGDQMIVSAVFLKKLRAMTAYAVEAAVGQEKVISACLYLIRA